MTNKITIPVIYSTDHNFVIPTMVSIKSMLLQSPDVRCDIYILHSDDVNDRDKELLNKTVNAHDSSIKYIPMGDSAAGGFEIRDISKSCYYRLYIPWLLPSLDKVLYIDGDTVIKSSIKELWDCDITDYYYGGIIAFATYNNDKKFIKYCKSINLDANHYINSGILSINSKLLRKDEMKERMISRVKEKLLYQDQDIINLECKGKIKLLPTRFNSNAGCALQKGYLNGELPAIIHYPGIKPWKNFTYYWRDWWDIYAQIPGSDPEMEIILSRNIMNIESSISFRKLIKILLKKIIKR